MPRDKDAEVRRVARELDALLARLEENVAAMSTILARPAQPPPEADERLVAP